MARITYDRFRFSKKINETSLQILLRELALLLWDLEKNNVNEDLNKLTSDKQIKLKDNTVVDLSIKSKQEVALILKALFKKIKAQVEKVDFEYKDMLVQSLYIEVKNYLEHVQVVPVKINHYVKDKKFLMDQVIKNLDQFIEIIPEGHYQKKIKWSLFPSKINRIIKDHIEIDITVETEDECKTVIGALKHHPDWTVEKSSFFPATQQNSNSAIKLVLHDQPSGEYFTIRVMTPEEAVLQEWKSNETLATEANTNHFFLRNAMAMMTF